MYKSTLRCFSHGFSHGMTLNSNSLNGAIFNITIEDGAAAIIGRITGAVAKAGVGIGVDVRIDSRF